MRATDQHHEPAVRGPGPRTGTGCAARLVREPAGDQRVDLHRALEVLARGFRPYLAVRIAVVPEPVRAAA